MMINYKLAILFFLSSLIHLPICKAEYKITVTSISKNIYMLSGIGGNIGVLTGEDGTFIIDDKFAPMTDTVLKSIISIGGDSPKFIINTHYHDDHTGGNENMGKKGSIIIAQYNVRKRLISGAYSETFKHKTPPYPTVALPLITYSNKLQFHINGETIDIIHTPSAHTDGDSFIHFKDSNVIHTGDLLFNGYYPNIDASAGGSMRGIIKAIDQIIAIADENSKIIPGHGPLADKKDLLVYRDMLSITYRKLLKLKNSGVSAEDAIKQKPLEQFDTEWSDGVFSTDRWIKIIYPAIY